jgi:hypothetical protein
VSVAIKLDHHQIIQPARRASVERAEAEHMQWPLRCFLVLALAPHAKLPRSLSQAQQIDDCRSAARHPTWQMGLHKECP